MGPYVCHKSYGMEWNHNCNNMFVIYHSKIDVINYSNGNCKLYCQVSHLDCVYNPVFISWKFFVILRYLILLLAFVDF